MLFGAGVWLEFGGFRGGVVLSVKMDCARLQYDLGRGRHRVPRLDLVRQKSTRGVGRPSRFRVRFGQLPFNVQAPASRQTQIGQQNQHPDSTHRTTPAPPDHLLQLHD